MVQNMNRQKKVLAACLPFLVSIAIMYGVSFFIGILAAVLAGSGLVDADGADILYEQSTYTMLMMATLCMHSLYIVVFYFWLRKIRPHAPFGEGNPGLRLRDCVILICLGCVLQIVLGMALNFILPLFPEMLKSYESLLDSMAIGEGVWPLVISGLLAPVGEELIFRGVTLAMLDDSLSFAWMNLMQAILFGIYHMNPVQFCYAFLMGLVLGLVYKKYHDLRACIVLHASINIWANVFSFLG